MGTLTLIMTNWIKDCFWCWVNAFGYRFAHYQFELDRCAFFEEINLGYYEMYIYPYDDMYNLTISKERKLRLNQ